MSEVKRRTAGRPPGPGKSASGHSQSLVRGLTLLERLAATPGGLALSELAEMVDLAPSTTHRLLQALQEELFARCGEVMQRIVQLPVPVIARVQGLATAAGCQLV
ncbi:helix-turn-helix domain-containing protein, partial [Billgrantia antri]|uniref:helix-turn-helix domain-containing protein n=1 Tax=Billgrantia antri TaxID=2846777 RepID=UPI003B212862